MTTTVRASHARCGLGDCDCGYAIDRLVTALKAQMKGGHTRSCRGRYGQVCSMRCDMAKFAIREAQR